MLLKDEVASCQTNFCHGFQISSWLFFFAETMSFALSLNYIHTRSRSWSCSRLHWNCRSVKKLSVFPDWYCPHLSLFDWVPQGATVTWTLSIKWLSLFKEVILTDFFFQGNTLNLRPYSSLCEWNWCGVALKKSSACLSQDQLSSWSNMKWL